VSASTADPTDRFTGTDDDPGLNVPTCLELYRKLAAGVAVVTSRHVDGPVGLTASSVTSVSLRPPILLLCLTSGSRTLSAIRARRAFAVHLLRDDQGARAQGFADPRRSPGGRFAGLEYVDILGVPVLSDALAWSVCFVEDERTYGDHCVVLGRVMTARVNNGRPLVWHDRRYTRLDRDCDSSDTNDAAGAATASRGA
jgi:flavin reductase (DIM6/NTAB) family NADH-FMN oxidoreductase RutF